jgi:hypothetical protein
MRRDDGRDVEETMGEMSKTSRRDDGRDVEDESKRRREGCRRDDGRDVEETTGRMKDGKSRLAVEREGTKERRKIHMQQIAVTATLKRTFIIIFLVKSDSLPTTSSQEIKRIWIGVFLF